MHKTIHVELFALFLSLSVSRPLVRENKSFKVAVTTVTQDTTSRVPRSVTKMHFWKNVMFLKYLFFCFAFGTPSSNGLNHLLVGLKVLPLFNYTP